MQNSTITHAWKQGASENEQSYTPLKFWVQALTKNIKTLKKLSLIGQVLIMEYTKYSMCITSQVLNIIKFYQNPCVNCKTICLCKSNRFLNVKISLSLSHTHIHIVFIFF
jgi:hypothetical protein